MTFQELIENAALDACGLLEDDERSQFERAFAQAPGAVQAAVRREQARLCDMSQLLPDVQPPHELRARVLQAVARLMAEDASQRQASVARLGAAGLTMLPSRRVSPVWRAAALACAAAAVVFGATTLQMRTTYVDLESALRDNRLADALLSELGPGMTQAFMDPAYRKVAFESPDEGFAGKAVVLYDEDSQTAYFLCQNLPTNDGQTYNLVVMDDQGRVVQTVASFTSDGRLMGRKFQLSAQAGSRLAIVPPGPGASGAQAVMASALL